jgi:hypothetical protein
MPRKDRYVYFLVKPGGLLGYLLKAIAVLPSVEMYLASCEYLDGF